MYNDTPNAAIEDAESAGGYDDFRYSIGLRIDGDGKVAETLWDSPAYQAGIVKDMQVLAVNGLAYSAERLKRAITTSKGVDQPIELILRQGEQYSSVRLDYREGLRHPHLQRIAHRHDHLSEILAPR